MQFLQRLLADVSRPYHGEDIAVVGLSVEQPVAYELRPGESRILSGEASTKKRSEFLLGRAAANLALKKLGLAEPPPVLQGAGRQPIWPQAIVGSITHCHPWAIVVAAKFSYASAIGIDLESAQRMQAHDIGNLICLDSELKWVSSPDDRLRRISMLFSAKEAVFKAFYPCCRRYFDFKDVRLSWIPLSNQFEGQLLTDLCPRHSLGRRFQIGCKCDGDLVFSFLIERASPDSSARTPHLGAA